MISIRSKQTKKHDCLCKRDFGLIPYKFMLMVCRFPNNYILSFGLIFSQICTDFFLHDNFTKIIVKNWIYSSFFASLSSCFGFHKLKLIEHFVLLSPATSIVLAAMTGS